MKTMKQFITLLFLLSVFLQCGTAFANDPIVFEPANSNSSLVAPKLTIAIDGTRATLSWSRVAGATGYQLHYTKYPYDNHPDSIKTGDVGNKTTVSFDLSPGDAYIATVTACKNAGSDCSSSSNIQNIVIPLPTFKNSLGQEFKLIPAGTFTMGSPLDEVGRKSGETQHQVTLTQPFYMQTTEVTQAQWRAVMGTDSFSSFVCHNCPVEMASWDDVQLYIEQINLRGEGIYSLPTEAQWEYSARAGSTTAFASGVITEAWCELDPNLDTIGWYCYNSDSQTVPVGQKSPNAWGLYDMSGNVGEWCQDWHGNYPTDAVTDPVGPLSGSSRVLRSGGWNFYAKFCRSAYRGYYNPGIRHNFTGFRLLKQP